MVLVFARRLRLCPASPGFSQGDPGPGSSAPGPGFVAGKRKPRRGRSTRLTVVPARSAERRLAHRNPYTIVSCPPQNGVWKPLAIEAVTEGKNAKAAENIATFKKGDMAARAAELLAETGWLPAMLRAA